MSLPCPRCGEKPLLVQRAVVLVPQQTDTEAYEAELWGRPTLPSFTLAFCNKRGCGWEGSLHEARIRWPKHPLI